MISARAHVYNSLHCGPYNYPRRVTLHATVTYVLNKRGIETENWQKTNDINTDLTATMKTKYGNTREIKIRDSIRQDGVLSVLIYTTVVIDQIAEEINKYELGASTNNTSHPKLECLLYMD